MIVEFVKGDCVWAQVKGEACWPARVMKPQIDTNQCLSYKVFFFYDGMSTADIEPKYLFHFMEHRQKFTAGVQPKSKLGRAIQQADKYIKKTLNKGSISANPSTHTKISPNKKVPESHIIEESDEPQRPVKIEKAVFKTPTNLKGSNIRQGRIIREKEEIKLRDNPKSDRSHVVLVDSQNQQREIPQQEIKEAASHIIKKICNELGPHGDDLIKNILKEALADKRSATDERLREQEEDLFDTIFGLINEPHYRIKERKEMIQRIIRNQREQDLEKHEFFFSSRIYVYFKYLQRVLEDCKELYEDSYELVKGEVELLGKAYDDTTMGIQSLDYTFSTLFGQELYDSAYQRLRRAGMLYLRLRNNANKNFVNIAKSFIGRLGIRLEDAVNSVVLFAASKIHTQVDSCHELSEEDIHQIITYRQ